jgi:membrane carboxypeptidase/penicillin-binding protein
VAGVWLGYDQPKPGGKGFTGGVVAAPLWERFMRAALANRPVVDFAKPDTVVTVSIDPASGLLAGPACPRQRDEYFASGNEPSEYCPLHGSEPAPALTTAPNGD